MIGTGVQMRPHPSRDRVYITPSTDGVDQPVVAAVGEVLVAEAEARQVGRVVGQPQVGRGVPARDLASSARVARQDADLLRNQQLAGTEDLPSFRGVLGR